MSEEIVIDLIGGTKLVQLCSVAVRSNWLCVGTVLHVLQTGCTVAVTI